MGTGLFCHEIIVQWVIDENTNKFHVFVDDDDDDDDDCNPYLIFHAQHALGIGQKIYINK